MDRRAIHAAIGNREQARSAMHIAVLTGQPLDSTLYHLRELEKCGVVFHWVDEGHVMRWERNPVVDEPLPF